MIDHKKTINALQDIADYFRACRENVVTHGSEDRRFVIYIEAAEEAAKLLKAQEPIEMTPEEAHAQLEKYGIPRYYQYSYAVGGDKRR